MVTFKSDLREAQERVEAWWRGENSGRPVLQITAPRDDLGAQNVYVDQNTTWSPPVCVVPSVLPSISTTNRRRDNH